MTRKSFLERQQAAIRESSRFTIIMNPKGSKIRSSRFTMIMNPEGSKIRSRGLNQLKAGDTPG
jgi:hypothetical protein